ncbi:hypothetical protein EZJ43_11565 [Pedobacter changchengzhani]|uniref:Grasp-with-spasm system SPASM domain peptide maturase n=1 Tax=Pedobacter changchengzhani TaxID=2529274 RepID=A0A4V3A033_9SPHI|nr:hypothetical protein [Pedobacter changchengzhani]TDG35653.1 hypothetical protein EZJ43_11565 [Pedobacter changchengzhani]
MNNLFLRNQLCIPIKGYNRSIIYDIGRKDYFFIPKKHYDILNTNGFIKFDKINDNNERKELINFLIKEEIIFEVYDRNQKNRFKSLDRNFEAPNLTTNIVIHSNINAIFFDFIKGEYLLNLSIVAPEIDDDLFRVLNQINGLEIDCIYLYIENFDSETFEEKRKLLAQYNLVFSVNFFNTKPKTELHQNIYYNFYEQDFPSYIRRLTSDKLNINNEHFLEAYNFHSYYNGKLYMDKDGYIKNGLTNFKSFGNINEMKSDVFLETISSSEFRELGEVKKTGTLVCCDCEFRYMCIDSRVPLKGKDKWYHDVECTYNPYLSVWENEEGYVNLNDSGVNVSASGVTIDKKKLAHQFKKLWGV